MKRIFGLQVAVFTAVLSGCASPAPKDALVMPVDDNTALRVVVNGAETSPVHAGMSAPRLKDGVPVHRVLSGAGGETVFAYDLTLTKNTEEGSYHLALSPAKKGPTFASAREVRVLPNEEVRVDLLEQPATHKKVVDVFTLDASDSTGNPVMGHLLAMHARFAKWVHGQ